MNTPLISIITATYNSGKVLERFIESLSRQTYTNYELIIIDGGSEDDTIRIIKKYENTIVKTWISEKDSGVYEAWNKGLKIVKGEWITFIGSDDVLYPHSFQNYIDFLDANHNRDINFISSKVELINKNNKVMRVLGSAWNWDISKKVCNIAHTGSLHNKSLFEIYGNYSTDYKICGDYEFLLRVGKNLNTAFMDKVTLKMFLGGLSDSKEVIKETCQLIYNIGSVSKFEMYVLYTFRIFKFNIKKVVMVTNIFLRW